MRGMALVYIQGARRTGRTTSLIGSLKDGDRVCCVSPAAAHHLQRQCREHGKQIECFSIPPTQAHRLLDRFHDRYLQGRTLFDHAWVEQYYLDALERTHDAIDELQQKTSAQGTAQCETPLQMREQWKWHEVTGPMRNDIKNNPF